jgi:hypothetical protein
MTKKERIIENLNVFLAAAVFSLVILMLSANASATLAFDNDCPVSSAANINFSNGTSVFLPFSYNQTSTTNSNITVFLGTNTAYFCSAIDNNLSAFTANRKVIFAPEFLNALKTSTCNSTFESYMENYRKSGNILNSTGNVFCGVRNITFDATTSPSGITFNYPIIGSGNLTIGGYVYNGTQVKKYMIAYLMNNPDVGLSGIVSTFANAVGINWSQGCSGITSLTDFFNAGKGNYTSKFNQSLLGINWTAGESLKPSGGAGGIFGWLLDFALGNQTLPVITAANLSANKIYACGFVTLTNDYSNSTITTTNNATTVNVTGGLNATLDISTNASVANSTIEIVQYPENPKTSGAVGIISLGKYVGIRMDSNLENALSSVIIKIYYTDSEVSAANLDESTLRLYYYNETSGSWQAYNSPNGGVNTAENYVWANTTHFSDWGIFGSIPAAGSSGGGCDMQGCTPWSSCSNNIQTRTCASNRGCGTVFETRKCEIIPALASKVSAEPEKAAETPSPAKTEAPETKETPAAVPLSVTLIGTILILIIFVSISWKIIEQSRGKKKKRK